MLMIVGLAVLLDLLLGEPANRWHPVAWMGRGLSRTRRGAHGRQPAALVALGAVAPVGLALLVAVLAWAVVNTAGVLGWPGVLLEAWLLKCTFSLRGLVETAREVKSALAAGAVEEARRRVGWHLVSRPTEALSPGHVASATVESVAENLTDSVVAPIFFYLLGGLPAAWAYRVVNTADAMWGYREGELEHLGKAAARLDDVLNWIPARVSGFAIVLGALVVGQSGSNAWRTMWGEHGRTASPNAGWTMAAMAGALVVTLEKPGAYRLGTGDLPAAATIDRALRVMVGASGLVVTAALAFAGLGR